jgi:two-component system LytT family response regulator
MCSHLFVITGDVMESQRMTEASKGELPNGSRLDRIVVRSQGKIILLHTAEVDWIEGARNYVRLHVGDHFHMLRERVSVLEKALAANKFVRIHRSTIVNTDKIKELQPCNNGEYMVILHSGKELSMSRGYRTRVHEFLQRSSVTGTRGR